MLRPNSRLIDYHKDLDPFELTQLHKHYIDLHEASELHGDEASMLMELDELVGRLGHSLEEEAKLRTQ